VLVAREMTALFNEEEWEARCKLRRTKKMGEDGEPVVAFDHYLLLGLSERYLSTEKQIMDGESPHALPLVALCAHGGEGWVGPASRTFTG